MANINKIIQKMKNQPNGIRIDEVHKVLTAFDYRLDRQKGSHRQYVNKTGDVITIKSENPFKKSLYKGCFRPNRGVINPLFKKMFALK